MDSRDRLFRVNQNKPMSSGWEYGKSAPRPVQAMLANLLRRSYGIKLATGQRDAVFKTTCRLGLQTHRLEAARDAVPARPQTGLPRDGCRRRCARGTTSANNHTNGRGRQMHLAAPVTKGPVRGCARATCRSASLGLPQLGDRCCFRSIDLQSIASDRCVDTNPRRCRLKAPA